MRSKPASRSSRHHEILHKPATLRLEHSTNDLGAVMKAAVPHEVPGRTRCAVVIVPCAEHEAREARHHDSARTHRARLEGDDERATPKTPVAQHLGRTAQRKDLGMSCRVACSLSLIAGRRDDLATRIKDDGTDGDIARRTRSRPLDKRQLHGVDIRDRQGDQPVVMTADSCGRNPMRLAMVRTCSSG